MRNRVAGAVVIALLLLSSCHDRADGGGMGRPPRHGRYAGIGVFDAGQLWSNMAVPKPAASQQAATIADDEHIIVVVDTDTGEVRECGDFSGYCTSFSPWTSAIAPAQRAPVALTQHAADLAREVAENAKQQAPAKP
jgi:hypothetical protein